ncbi:MAG TPA: hypothetical protein VGG97_21435 [Bryobacteraceae bacterium]
MRDLSSHKRKQRRGSDYWEFGSLEHAQAIAAHEGPRTTKFYDRASDEITLDKIERIGI